MYPSPVIGRLGLSSCMAGAKSSLLACRRTNIIAPLSPCPLWSNKRAPSLLGNFILLFFSSVRITSQTQRLPANGSLVHRRRHGVRRGRHQAMGAIFEFSHEANEAMEDLNAMARELQTLDPIIGSLTTQFWGAPRNTVMDALTKHLEGVVGECVRL